MRIIEFAWHELVRAAAAITRRGPYDSDQPLATALGDSRMARALQGALNAISRAAANSQVALWHAQWSASLPPSRAARVRFWSAAAATAALVHLVTLLVVAGSRAPLQWVLPVSVLASAGLAWVLARLLALQRAAGPR